MELKERKDRLGNIYVVSYCADSSANLIFANFCAISFVKMRLFEIVLQGCLRVTYVSTFRLFQFFPRSSCSFVSLYVIANFGMKILQKFSMRFRETEGSRHKGISLHDRMRE